MDFDIVVVANHHRKPLVIDYLKGIDYKISYTEDFNLPVGWQPKKEYEHLVRTAAGHLGHHRCIKGHHEALKLSTKDRIVVMEDDAVPNVDNWMEYIERSVKLLDRFEIVSCHGRSADYSKFNQEGFFGKSSLYVPKDTTSYRYVLGSLVYSIKKEHIPRILSHNYDGLPMDIFIANKFYFAFLGPSCMDHNRSQGSLIDIGVRN